MRSASCCSWLANYVLLRPAFAPLERLAERMGDVDLLRPGGRLTPTGSPEVVGLVRAFNTLLGWLEHERREAGARTLQAQEEERQRLARGPARNREVGQSMTAVLLQLKRLTAITSNSGTAEIKMAEVQEVVKKSLDDVRRLAQELRPELLDHLGLAERAD